MRLVSPIDLRWAAPPGDGLVVRPLPGGSRRGGWPEIVRGGPAAALARLRTAFDGPLAGRGAARRLVVNGGDPPEFLAAVDAAFRRPGDELVLLPPTPNGTPELGSLDLALSGGPPARSTVLLGAAAPTGALLSLDQVTRSCERWRAQLVLDLTLARFSLGEDVAGLCPAGVLGGLDRWDGEPAGCWGVAVRPPRLPWAGVAPTGLVHLDAALRGALAVQHGFTVWPLGARRHALGLVAFACRRWSAGEAAALLAEAFGIVLESACLTAVPLPFSAGLGRGLLRASIGPSTSPDEIVALGDALSRLDAVPPAAAVAH